MGEVDWGKFGKKQKPKVDWADFGASKGKGKGGGPLGVVKGVLTSGPVNTALKVLDLPRKGLLTVVPGANVADKVARAVGPKEGAAGLAFNTALDIAEDPLTYVSFGTAGAAKTGLKVVAKEVSKEAAERVAKGGMKALTAAERAKVAAKTTPKVMTKLDRGAKGGVKVLGHTAPGLGSRGPVLHGVTAAGSKAKGAFVGSKVGKAFVSRARVEAEISKDVAEDFGSLYAKARASKSHGIAAREKRLLAAARGTENLSDADLDVLEAALDIGGRGVDVPARLRPALDVLKAERAASRGAQETHGFLPTFAEAQAKAAAKATKKIDAQAAKAGETVERVGAQAARARALADEARDAAVLPTDRIAVVAGQAARAQDNAARVFDKGLGTAIDARQAAAASRGRLGESVGRAVRQGEGLGRAEQRARTLANIARSAEIRQSRLQAKAAEKGAKAAGKVMDPEEYVGRFYSPQGKAFLAKHPEVAAKLGVKPKALAAALDQGGHLKARTLFPELSAQQIEKKVGTAFREAGMKGPLLDHNPFVNVARSGALADAAIAEKQFLEGVIDLPADVMRRAEKGAKLPHGWKEVDGGPLGKLHAHPAIADEVERVRAVVVNDEAIKEFRGLMGKWHTMWKAQATVPLIGGGGFHLRNAQGNMFNNFLAGVKNPATYARAIVIQNKVRAGRPLTKAERRIVDLAKERGVLDEGFFLNDLMDPAAKGGLLGMVTKEKRGARVRQAANPFSTEGVLTKTGRSVGSAIENNARLTHFIAKLDELGDADAAARSVKKYLFDYGDLTPFERGVKQWAVPFYTFLRKNTPLQFSNMATQPGKYAAKAHAYNNLAAGRDRDELPTFLQDEPYLPFHLRGQTIAIRPDLPDDAALESVNPIKQSDLGLLGGPGFALLKYLTEEKTGKSLYTGFNTKGSTPQRLAEAALPLTGKIRRAPYGSDLPTGAGIGLNSDDPEQQLARLIAALTGLRAYRTDTE